MPRMILMACAGAPDPNDRESFSCPLMVASRDEAGADILGAPIAHVQIPTKIPAVRCAVRDVRLLFYV